MLQKLEKKLHHNYKVFVFHNFKKYFTFGIEHEHRATLQLTQHNYSVLVSSCAYKPRL